MLMISIENFILLMSAILVLGAFMIWRHGQKSYDKGITDAILMHRNGRLTYKDYLDDNGKKMVDIDIEPLDED